jgi:DNA-binding NtrC family response regulator
VSVLSALIGTSTVIRHVQHLVVKVAESDAPVLITGETGTGKEFLARTIHEKSSRGTGAFVHFKCAAAATDALDTELFGSALNGNMGGREGAMQKTGNGTLFIDEVTKLNAKVQALLLKVIQDGCFETANGETIRVQARIICATTANIDQCVRDRSFREDLYYRLAGCAVYVPPLRERREDIAPLVEHFIQKYNSAKGKNIFGVSPDAMQALLQHSWNHNIREMENLMERIVVLKTTGSIEVCDLPPRLRQLVTDNIDSFYETQQPRNPSQPQAKSGTRDNNPQSSNRPAQHMHAGSQANNTSQTLRSHNGSAPLSNTLNAMGTVNYNVNRMPQAHFNSSFPQGGGGNFNTLGQSVSTGFEDSNEIEQFIKKEIDLGGGIDFYRVVEEFENRLIAEALRRTNHNKNRAAQLLSMNRTTLVEKLKKRAASSSVKVETGRVKRNPAFAIYDGLGSERRDFEGLDYVTSSDLGDID